MYLFIISVFPFIPSFFHGLFVLSILLLNYFIMVNEYVWWYSFPSTVVCGEEGNNFALFVPLYVLIVPRKDQINHMSMDKLENVNPQT